METNETKKCEHCDTCKSGTCCAGCGSAMCSGKGCHSGNKCMMIMIVAVIAAFFIGMWVANASMHHRMRRINYTGMIPPGQRIMDSTGQLQEGAMPVMPMPKQ